MKNRIALVLCCIAFWCILSEDARAGIGIGLTCGPVSVNNGNFRNALNNGPQPEYSSTFYGLGFFAGNNELALGLSWYGFKVGNSPSSGSSNQYMLDFIIRPLELGSSAGMSIRLGFGLGVGETEATLDKNDFQGSFMQPEISLYCPLSCSDDGYWREGKHYPRSIVALDIRIGVRSSTITSDMGTGDKDLDWGGGFISVGLVAYFNQ